MTNTTPQTGTNQPPIPGRPTETDYVIERHDGNQWLPIGYPRPTLQEAQQIRDDRRATAPADRFRILEWTATARVVESDDVPAGTEDTEAGQAPEPQHYDKVPDPADGCHWCACGNRWPCEHATAVTA